MHMRHRHMRWWVVALLVIELVINVVFAPNYTTTQQELPQPRLRLLQHMPQQTWGMYSRPPPMLYQLYHNITKKFDS